MNNKQKNIKDIRRKGLLKQLRSLKTKLKSASTDAMKNKINDIIGNINHSLLQLS